MNRVLLFVAALLVLVPAGAFAADQVSGTTGDVLCATCGGGGGTTTTTATTTPTTTTTTTTTAPPPTTTTTTVLNYNAQTLGYDGVTLSDLSDTSGPVRILTASGMTLTCPTGYRVKTRVYTAHWHGSIAGGISWKVEYSVCYSPTTVLWARVFPAFSPSTSWPVNWDDLNDAGFPTFNNVGSSVTFRWQGSANSCVLPNVFCTHRHPGTQIIFYPNDTERISGWGG